jgi:hypothetical protein
VVHVMLGVSPGTKYLVTQQFAAGGMRSYLGLLGRN